jgi:hypothetical protein
MARSFILTTVLAYSSMIRMRQMLRSGAVIRVVNPVDLPDGALIGCGGGAGSPTVGIEKLPGDEMLEAQRELAAICDKAPTHMIAIEIGGMNGLQSRSSRMRPVGRVRSVAKLTSATGMILGASSNMDIPAVDGDWSTSTLRDQQKLMS